MKNRLMDSKVITFSFLLKSKFYHLILRFLSVWFNTEHRKSISNMKEECKIIIEITGSLEILSSAWTLMNLYVKALNVSEKNLLKMTWFVSVIDLYGLSGGTEAQWPQFTRPHPSPGCSTLKASLSPPGELGLSTLSIGCPPFSLGSGASPLAPVDHTGISLFATRALWTEWRNPLPSSACAAHDRRQSPWGGGWAAGTGRWQAGFQKESFARTRDAPATHLLLPAVDN